MVTPEGLTLETEAQSLKVRQKEVAVSRLMQLGVPVRIRRDYERFGRLHMCTSPSGSYAHIDDKDMLAEIANFEKQYEATVYLVVRMATFYGLLDSLIFVSKYEEEWENEIVNLKDGYLLTYTINRDHTMCSEFGDICFERTDNGGIIRIG